MSKTDIKVFWCLAALFAIQIVWFYPKLPQVMSVHFNQSGRADGWAGKQTFLWFYIGITVLLMAPCWALRRWAHKLPNGWINIPKKDYWLSPENRERTLNMLTGRVLWFGNITFLLLIFVFHFTYMANTGPENRLPPAFWGVLISYFVVTILWSVYFAWPFIKGKSDW